ITLSCDKDVEIISSVSDYMSEPVLYVTSGPELVAKYQFFCRSPFTIDETTYLQEGVSEEQHRQAIRDLVGGLPIVCSHHILELMFNEPQLLLVYRVALEIEMVYGIPNDDEENEDPAQFLNLTGEEHISMDEGVTIPPEDPANYDPNIEDAYWDGMMDNETGYEVYLSQSPHPTEGVLGLQLAPNKRLTTLTSNILTNCDIIIHIGVSSAAVSKQNTSSTHEVVVATDPAVTATNTEPCLDLSLGIGFDKNSTDPEVTSSLQEFSCLVQTYAQGNGRLTPRVKDIMEANFDQSGGLLVSRINNDEYEVKEKNGSSFYVNLDTKSCSCYSFQMLLIPCPHAIAAAIKENVSIESLVSDFYTLKTLAAGYAEDIVPIRSEVNTCGITIDGQNEPLQIFPPASRRPPGKPRKSRILSTGEIRVSNR
ncbi:unnamed protein product, partial [Brassica oleracea]